MKQFLISLVFFSDRSTYQAAGKSIAADPTSRTVGNTDTVIQQKSNWRQKVKSTFKNPSSRPNGVTTSKPNFKPQGTRIAFLAVKIQTDDVTKVDSDVIHFEEKIVCDHHDTDCEAKIEAKSSATIVKSDLEVKEQGTEQTKVYDGENENIKISTVLGQVSFCNGSATTAANQQSLTCTSENQITFCPEHDVTDHVTTISVDVHNLDSLRGNFKASPVSSAGPECSCGESCPCSSFDSEDERPGKEPFINDVTQTFLNPYSLCRPPLF